jgi:hypothetical protein
MKKLLDYIYGAICRMGSAGAVTPSMSLGSLQDGGLRIVELSCRGSTLQVYGFQ